MGMKKLLLVLGVTLLMVGSNLQAQSFFTADDHLVNGYARKLAGLDFEYMSCIPGHRSSLLLRANNGKDFVEWETDPAPVGIKQK